MVVAEQKPVEEILAMVTDFDKILLTGCKGCVTVCCSGGQKEVGILASALKIARKKEGREIEIDETSDQIRDNGNDVPGNRGLNSGIDEQIMKSIESTDTEQDEYGPYYQ